MSRSAIPPTSDPGPARPDRGPVTAPGSPPPTGLPALPDRPGPGNHPAAAGFDRTTDALAEIDPDVDADARALASTLRLRILRLCLDRARTNREIADRLGRNPASVLHHVRTLVDRGFLVAEPVRRGARGSREVPYRATGKSWRMPQPPGQQQVMVNAFLEELAEAPADSVSITRLGVRLSAEQHRELTARVDAFFQELADRRPTEGGDPYSMLFVMHLDTGRLDPGPTARSHAPDGTDPGS